MDGATIQLFGHLGSDVECRYTGTGKMIANPSLAVETGRGDHKSTEWYKLVFWEKSAELVNNLAKKGTFLFVAGIPKLETWEDKDGTMRSQIAVTVKEFRILRNGKSRDEQEEEDEENPYGAE